MKKLPFVAFLLIAIMILPACGLDPDTDRWEYYEDWRNANNAWLETQIALTDDDGSPYYERIVPDYDMNAYVLMRFLNDRSKTEGNLSPLYTSTVDVKYIGRTYDDAAFDSSYLLTESYGDSIYRTKLADVISGWSIALMNMRVGDSCEVVIPYEQAYQNIGSGSILPYSNLKFNIKLVDIPGYEKNVATD